MATYIKIRNWNIHQHYKNRKPPWIKLYRDILDDPHWHTLSDFAGKLLIELWLLASEGKTQGIINLDSTALAWRLRISGSEKKIEKALQQLAIEEFITLDSTMLADCTQDATPEREANIETNSEREKTIFPPELDNEEFKEKWQYWLDYRKEIKKPYKSAKSETAQLNALAKHGTAIAIEAIDRSVASQWQGLFPEKVQATGRPVQDDRYAGIDIIR